MSAARVCYPALNEYFSFQNIFTDLTLFEGIRLLPPASTLTLDLAGDGHPQRTRYWDYPLRAGAAPRLRGRTASSSVHHLFVQAVTRQLISDVPVGAYLSGGMDSGSITSIAARHVASASRPSPAASTSVSASGPGAAASTSAAAPR